MAQKDKRLERWRNNPTGVRFEELASVLRGCGFEQEPGRGSHTVFRHPARGLTLSVPHHGNGPVKPVYVRKVLQLVDDYGCL
jgi:predicted RNA binding protein YcfA (HicA-like mRNA interferase family)